MGWLQQLVEQALGLPDQSSTGRQLEPPRQEVVFDPRGSGYSAGQQLFNAMEQMRNEELGLRKVRAVQREHHRISETEYIDTETVVEIEEGHFYREWGY